jgi:hypothetical protein
MDQQQRAAATVGDNAGGNGSAPNWNQWRTEIRAFCDSLRAELAALERRMVAEPLAAAAKDEPPKVAPSREEHVVEDRLAALRKQLTSRMLACPSVGCESEAAGIARVPSRV